MTTWILVAGRTGAKIFESAEWGLRRLEVLLPMNEPEIPQTETSPSAFALRLAAHLERAYQRGDLERLVLVADAGFLGLLRMWLSKPVAALVLTSIARDLGELDDDDLQAHLDDSIPPGAPDLPLSAMPSRLLLAHPRATMESK